MICSLWVSCIRFFQISFHLQIYSSITVHANLSKTDISFISRTPIVWAVLNEKCFN